MRYFSMYLIITTFFISCSKDDSLSTELVSTKYEILSSPQVYTRQGEIIDKSVIENYISGWCANYFVFNTDTVINEPAHTIYFKTRDTLIIPEFPDQWGTRVVKKSGEYFIFSLPDTLRRYKRIDNVLNSIVDKIGIVKPFYGNACYGGTDCFVEWVYDSYIATGSISHLEFPLITYKITRRVNGLNAGIAFRNYNNVFDKAVLNLLQDGDTLAIQTAKRIYSRRN